MMCIPIDDLNGPITSPGFAFKIAGKNGNGIAVSGIYPISALCSEVAYFAATSATLAPF